MMAIGSLRPSALSTLPIDGAYGLGEILWGCHCGRWRSCLGCETESTGCNSGLDPLILIMREKGAFVWCLLWG